MNETLIEFLLRDVVSKLPEEKRRVYEYVVEEEDYLASQANTADELLQLLIKHSPHRMAANKFQMSYGAFVAFMHEIENEISEKLEARYEKVRWIDYTEKLNRKDQQLFLFVN